MIAVSHCGAHWLIPTLDLITTEILPDGRIKFRIDATAEQVAAAHKDAIKSSAPPKLVKINERKAHEAAAAKAKAEAAQPTANGTANGVAAH